MLWVKDQDGLFYGDMIVDDCRIAGDYFTLDVFEMHWNRILSE